MIKMIIACTKHKTQVNQVEFCYVLKVKNISNKRIIFKPSSKTTVTADITKKIEISNLTSRYDQYLKHAHNHFIVT